MIYYMSKKEREKSLVQMMQCFDANYETQRLITYRKIISDEINQESLKLTVI